MGPVYETGKISASGGPFDQKPTGCEAELGLHLSKSDY